LIIYSDEYMIHLILYHRAFLTYVKYVRGVFSRPRRAGRNDCGWRINAKTALLRREGRPVALRNVSFALDWTNHERPRSAKRVADREGIAGSAIRRTRTLGKRDCQETSYRATDGGAPYRPHSAKDSDQEQIAHGCICTDQRNDRRLIL